LIDKITVITWVIFLTSMVMIYYIRKLTLKLIRAHYNVYSIMAALEEQEKAKPARER